MLGGEVILGKLRTPYRQRILYFCERQGVVVPANFDAPKSSDRFAVIDITTEPHLLVNRTTYRESEVVEFLLRPENMARKFKILDFKRGLELAYEGSTKLSKVAEFDCKSPGELLTLVSTFAANKDQT